MDKKTKVKITFVMTLVIIAIIVIIMIIFVKGNRKSKNNIPTKPAIDESNSNNDLENDEGETLTLEGIDSLAILNNTLVKVKTDGSFELVKDFSYEENKFVDYTYDNENAYIVYSKTNEYPNKTVIYKIDLLKSNYNQELVYESEIEDYYDDIIVNEDKIYYTTREKKIIEYSINEEIKETLLAENVEIINGSLSIDKESNKIYYIASEDGETNIYSMDLGTFQVDKVINGFEYGFDLFLCNNQYLVCNVNKSNYLYNIASGNIFEIGPNINSDLGHGAKGRITYYKNDFIVYTDEQKIILKDFEGNTLNNALYTVENGYYISDISMITQNKLQIKLNKIPNVDDETTYDMDKWVVIDFETGETERSVNLYTNIINIV